MKKQRKKIDMDMLHGPLAGKLFLFALPLALSQILQQLFNSADLAVVGRFSSSEAMAAVGSNASVINLIVSLFTGLSVGANVVIATMIGQNQKDKINEAVHTIMLTAIISGIVLIFVGIGISRPLLVMMDAPDNVMNLAIKYLRIYFLAMAWIMIYDFGSAILRSKGDSARPLYALIASGIMNVVLNLFFVIKLGMDVDGVAIPTVISNAFSACLILWFLMHEEPEFRLSFKKLSIQKEHLINMLKIGLPAGLQGMVFSLSNVVIQSAINSFGSDAIAGNTAGQNFEFMTYFIINAFAQAAVTFTSQNYGAKNEERCRRVFLLSNLLGMSLNFGLALIFWFGRAFFIQFFTEDPAVMEYAFIRMRDIMLFELLTGTYEISGGCLRGMGRSMAPAVLTVLGSCVLRLIYIATIFRVSHTIDTLMIVYPISWVVTGSAVLFVYFRVRKSLFARFHMSVHA